MNRGERWVAILLFGGAIFSAESVVRAASPANPACVRSGIVGLLRTATLDQKQKTTPASNQPTGQYQQEIAQAENAKPLDEIGKVFVQAVQEKNPAK